MKKIIIIALCAVVVALAIILAIKVTNKAPSEELSVKEIYNKIAQGIALPDEMVERNSSDLDMRYGINTTVAKDYIYMANATSYYVDTIAIFKVENSDDRQNIKSKLESIKKQAMDSMNNYDAKQYKIATDGVVYTQGEYVILIMTSDTNGVKNIIKENI